MDFLFDTPSRPFKTLDFHFPEQEALKIFSLFDDVCELFENFYDFSSIDHAMDEFIANTNTPLVNASLKFKNLNLDSLKYQNRTNREFDIHSYPYFEGLCEHLQKKFSQKDKSLEFLAAMNQCHQWIKKQIQPMLEEIEKKIQISTVLKVWKHNSLNQNPHFLPVHCDRTVFTIVVHTKSEGVEGLRIYPPESMSDPGQNAAEAQPVIPTKQDFPLMFPGRYAKPWFPCEPVPHCVVSDPSSRERYSLVLFIARFEGW